MKKKVYILADSISAHGLSFLAVSEKGKVLSSHFSSSWDFVDSDIKAHSTYEELYGKDGFEFVEIRNLSLIPFLGTLGLTVDRYFVSDDEVVKDPSIVSSDSRQVFLSVLQGKGAPIDGTFSLELKEGYIVSHKYLPEQLGYQFIFIKELE